MQTFQCPAPVQSPTVNTANYAYLYFRTSAYEIWQIYCLTQTKIQNKKQNSDMGRPKTHFFEVRHEVRHREAKKVVKTASGKWGFSRFGPGNSDFRWCVCFSVGPAVTPGHGTTNPRAVRP